MNKVVKGLRKVGLCAEGAAWVAVKVTVQLPTKIVGAVACTVSELTDEVVNAWGLCYSRRLAQGMNLNSFEEDVEEYFKEKAKENFEEFRKARNEGRLTVVKVTKES